MDTAPGLHTVVEGADPSWLDDFDPSLISAARTSPLGRRLLARTLAGGAASTLLAPAPKPALDRVVARWSAEKMRSLVRNIGVLAFAPAIRSEVGRETVRRLKLALDKRYLLALDRNVWDGEVPRDVQVRLQQAMHTALEETDPTPALLSLFDRHGCSELRAWAHPRDPAFTEWLALLHPRDQELLPTHLPPSAVQQLYSVHAGN